MKTKCKVVCRPLYSSQSLYLSELREEKLTKRERKAWEKSCIPLSLTADALNLPVPDFPTEGYLSYQDSFRENGEGCKQTQYPGSEKNK